MRDGPATVVRAWSAMEEYELDDYADGVARALPHLRLEIERMSTAALRERLLDPASTGQWDVILGWALTTMQDAALQHLFAHVDTPAFAVLPESARDPGRRWFAPSGFIPALCVDPAALARHGLAVPGSWADLGDPRYRGLLSIPDPAYSGAGFLHVSALLQLRGPDAAWALMEAVAANRPAIVQSAFAPCLAVAAGTAAVGITVTTAAERMVRMGLALDLVVPEDAAGFEPEAFALGSAAREPAAGLEVLEWMLGADACAIYRQYRKVVLVGAAAAKLPVAIDAGQAAAARSAVCAQWRATFSGALADA